MKSMPVTLIVMTIRAARIATLALDTELRATMSDAAGRWGATLDSTAMAKRFVAELSAEAGAA